MKRRNTRWVAPRWLSALARRVGMADTPTIHLRLGDTTVDVDVDIDGDLVVLISTI